MWSIHNQMSKIQDLTLNALFSLTKLENFIFTAVAMDRDRRAF